MKANETMAIDYLINKFPEIQDKEYFSTWATDDVISFYNKIKILYTISENILVKWHAKPSNMYKKEPSILAEIRKVI